MCSITTNRTVDEILEVLERSANREMIERKLYHLAKEANEKQQGRLDQPDLKMKRMPDELKNARKIQIGRHRVYFTGYHTQCRYSTFFIKMNKKSGVNDDDDPRFQKLLGRALEVPQARTIKDPDKPDEAS